MRVFDAFCGIGGFRAAISASRILRQSLEVTIACDIDAACRRVYQSRWGTSEQFIADIMQIGTINTDGIDLKKIDVVAAGFPCQPFTNVGKKGGLSDPRAATFDQLISIMTTYQPRLALLENVQKITSFDRGKTYAQIVARLENAGYEVHLLDLCASDFGVPQQRRRMYFACFRRRKKKRAPFTRKPLTKESFRTTWDLLEREMPVEHLVPARTSATVFRKNSRWQGDLNINRAIARPICATMGKWHRANQDNYFSCDYVFGPPPNRSHRGRSYKAGDLVRRITVLEALRLQGFPDSHLSAFGGVSLTTAYRLIGNAVAVPVAKQIFEWMLDAS